jgi:hypothetical protein
LSAPLSATAYKLIDEIVAASEEKLGYLGWAMYGDNNPSHPIHKLNSCEQTRVWEVLTARKGAILFQRLYAKLCSTWVRALPSDCFIFLAVFKEFLEAQRLRKALSIVRNKQRVSPRSAAPAPRQSDPTHGHSAVKRGAVARSPPQTGSCVR